MAADAQNSHQDASSGLSQHQPESSSQAFQEPTVEELENKSAEDHDNNQNYDKSEESTSNNNANQLGQSNSPLSHPHSQTCHPMITRTKSDIFKPKIYSATTNQDESMDYNQNVKNKNWRTTMKEEYNGLIKNNI